MKRILITTNFSNHSTHTIQYVLNLVSDTQIPCEVLLVNTYMVQQTDPKQVILMNDQMKQRSKEGLELDRQVALSHITNPNITVGVASHMGSLKNVIMHLLNKEKIDLVAMGKNGGRHVETVSHLLKQRHCPLLITYCAA